MSLALWFFLGVGLGTRLALCVFEYGTSLALCSAYVSRTAVRPRLLRGWDPGSPARPPRPQTFRLALGDAPPPAGGLAAAGGAPLESAPRKPGGVSKL